MDTSGFYKNDNGNLLFGPNYVLNKDYELRRETDAKMEVEIDGWMFYDSEELARIALDLPIESN